jgi:hypothetical protein
LHYQESVSGDLLPLNLVLDKPFDVGTNMAQGSGNGFFDFDSFHLTIPARR